MEAIWGTPLAYGLRLRLAWAVLQGEEINFERSAMDWITARADEIMVEDGN
jgi:hypothetical protein